MFYYLLKAGRWLAATHPEAADPACWTRELAAEYVAAVDRMRVGEWAHAPATHRYAERLGQPQRARTKDRQLGSLRTFFHDAQEWGWVPRRFDSLRALATPRAVRALIGPDPRAIADDYWAKLLWAGLNLAAEDLPRHATRGGAWYPLALVRAAALLWLFAGLRNDELVRLRVGCVRWQREDVAVAGTAATLPRDAVCLLDVPAHKTGRPFTKPVDRAVGAAIAAWEAARPAQPPGVDPKTGEAVQFLFAYRGQRLGRGYLNRVLIPLLCRKANLPRGDARGPFTSHRARSTIATQLYNAREPLSLTELQEWLGHRTPLATQQYAKIAPTRLARAYADADYFRRNVRRVEVLLDQDAVRDGAAAAGAPWRFYDLGHGYCTYDFFDQCPHRMACAKCAFYRPKGSTAAQLLEGKANLLRLQQEIPLTEEERAAVDDGLAALEHLCAQLAAVPTPAGPTPRDLGRGRDGAGLPVLPARGP
jgi:integrase